MSCTRRLTLAVSVCSVPKPAWKGWREPATPGSASSMRRLSMTAGAFLEFAISTAAAHPDFTRKPRVIPNPWNRVRHGAWLLENAWEVGCGVWELQAHSPYPTTHAVGVLPLSPPARSPYRHPWPTYRLPRQKARRARSRGSGHRHRSARSRSSFPFRLQSAERRSPWRSPAAGERQPDPPPDIGRLPADSPDRD